MAANVVDRVVAWLNPRAGLLRAFHRTQLRAYEAASPRDKWRPRRGFASADADHQADAAKLRAKARSLVQNVPYIRAGLEARVSAMVGTGIMPRATGKDKDNINKLFLAWSKVCDADGRLDYFGMMAAAARAMEQDGEVLIRLRPRFASDALPVPLQMQLLEIDWLDSRRNGIIEQNTVVNGIVYDVLGRLVGYYLWNQHPGDIGLFRGTRIQSAFVDASLIVHLFAPERPGQGRGFTRIASVIARTRDLQLYEDAELARKNLETRMSVLYSGDPALQANPAADGQSADPAAIAKTGQLGDLPSGSMQQLPMGSNITVVTPTVAPGYVDYVKYQLHLIAAGMGVTYEMMTGDMTGVTFSSARVRLLDFRREIEQLQWLVLVPRLLEPIHRAFIDAGVLGGMIRSRDYTAEYATPKWDYVNPQQDVAADLAEVSGGMSSISEKLRRRGYNPPDVFKELANDFKTLRELGVLDVMLLLQKGRVTDIASPDSANDANNPPPAAAAVPPAPKPAASKK